MCLRGTAGIETQTSGFTVHVLNHGAAMPLADAQEVVTEVLLLDDNDSRDSHTGHFRYVFRCYE